MEGLNLKPKQEKILTEQERSIQEVFKLCPELEKIGSQDQYRKYLETIFPESKVKNILYHATKGDWFKENKFNPEFISRGNVSFGEGFYFTDKLENHQGFKGADNMAIVIVNIKNIFNDSIEQKNQREKPKFNPYVTSHEKMLEVQKAHNEFLQKNHDGVIATYNNKNEYVVFDPENIHILGSQSDIEKFKKFVVGQNT